MEWESLRVEVVPLSRGEVGWESLRVRVTFLRRRGDRVEVTSREKS